ncbi:unnamed protein product [Caenorhabditis sp. 36 PRJEB53466]|nr:unnamed protein product [Caenorhabditis sp. 36 PRJEB53466]
MTFESEVEADRDSFFRGTCKQLEYGKTPTGQKFATVITSGAWYAPGDRFLFKTQHATWDGALEKKKEYHRQLTHGKFKAFLCNLPAEKRYRRNIFSAVTHYLLDDQDFESRDFSSARIVKTTPSDCADRPDKYLKRGDIVQTDFLLAANHEGIYIGNGKVIHVSGHGGGKSASVAREGRLLGDFVGKSGESVRVLVLRLKFRTGEEIARQAEAYSDGKFREGEYDLFMEMCSASSRTSTKSPWLLCTCSVEIDTLSSSPMLAHSTDKLYL